MADWSDLLELLWSGNDVGKGTLKWLLGIVVSAVPAAAIWWFTRSTGIAVGVFAGCAAVWTVVFLSRRGDAWRE